MWQIILENRFKRCRYFERSTWCVKMFQIFRAYSSWTKPKWCSASGCRELIGKGGEGGGSPGEGNIHKNYSHHNHQLHDNHHHHHDNHHHYHDNHHHHRHSTTVPSSKVPPRLAGCPSVTLRGTSYQCRSFWNDNFQREDKQDRWKRTKNLMSRWAGPLEEAWGELWPRWARRGTGSCGEDLCAGPVQHRLGFSSSVPRASCLGNLTRSQFEWKVN